jgi:hypothetical protein
MPVSLEERLLLRRLGMDPAFSNDLSTGGLYGQPDAMNPGGLRMQQGTRDFRALTGPNPTRMSQPIVGGTIPSDANDLRQEADLSQYQGELSALDGLSAKAGPLWDDLPSGKDEAFALLMQRGAQPGEMGDVANFMAGNMSSDPLGRYGKSGGPVAKMGTPSQRKYAPGRQEELASRQQAVQDRAQRKGLARETRMGGGDQIALQRQMEMLNMLNSGGSGGPGSVGPGGMPSPALLHAMGLPPHIIQEMGLAQDRTMDNARGNEAIEVQRENNRLQGDQNKLHRDKMILESMPANLRTLIGPRALALKQKIEDTDVMEGIQMARSAGLGDYGGILDFLQKQGIPHEHAKRVLNTTAPQPPLSTETDLTQPINPMAPPEVVDQLRRQRTEAGWAQYGQFPPSAF